MNSGVIPAVLAGFGTSLSLIVAIGAQNAFVLRQGLRRQAVFAVVAVCAVSDAVLIALGVAGFGTLVTAWPGAVAVVSVAGGVFLLAYGALAARRALHPTDEALRLTDNALRPTDNALRPTDDALHSVDNAPSPASHAVVTAGTATTSVRVAVLTCLALTWLNPHVYLDTVLLLGSVAADRGGQRWAFGAGAVAASLLWFTGLGYGARLLGGVLSRPSAWRVLDAVIAATMLALGGALLARTVL